MKNIKENRVRGGGMECHVFLVDVLSDCGCAHDKCQISQPVDHTPGPGNIKLNFEWIRI